MDSGLSFSQDLRVNRIGQPCARVKVGEMVRMAGEIDTEQGTKRPPVADSVVTSARARKGFLWILFLSFVAILALAPEVFLLFFCAVLFAVFLDALASLVESRGSMRRGWSLTIVLLFLLGVATGLGFFVGPHLNEQVTRFSQEVPKAIDQLRTSVSQSEFGREAAALWPKVERYVARNSTSVSKASAVLSSTFNIVVDVVVVLFVGVYLAANPSLYSCGFAKLFPPAKRPRIEKLLCRAGSLLQHWLMGRLLLMGSNAVATALGLWLLGIPLALTLGLLSGLLNFIPNFGPIIAAIPAVLIAFLESPAKALWVALFYLLYQSLDGYLLTPLVQKRTVSLPPALTIMAQVLFGVLLGPVGVLLAVPLTALGYFFMRTFYREDVLLENVAAC